MRKRDTTRTAEGRRVILQNKRARHEYAIEDTWEAGISLVGSEVKSLRDGKANLSDAYALVEEGEVFLVNCHIAEYPQANRFNHEPRRRRKLLLHAAEIRKISVKVRERGYTLVPLSLYFKGAHVKVEIGLARGRKLYDRREELRRRDQEREVSRALSAGRRRDGGDE